MTKEEFFNKSVEERKSLVERAHPYYETDLARETNKIPEKDVREFIEMCNEERIKFEKKSILNLF